MNPKSNKTSTSSVDSVAAINTGYQPEWILKDHRCPSADPLQSQLIPVLQSSTAGFGQPVNTELFHRLFERRVDSLGLIGSRKAVAVEYPSESYHYAALEKLANRIARFLMSIGVTSGDRIGLLLDRTVYSYASTLGVMKAGAAYVPLDAGFPPDRLEYMLRDSGVKYVLTLSRYMSLFTNPDCTVIAVDGELEAIEKMSGRRPKLSQEVSPNSLCYVIYTSGSTGRPKGVPISHANIASFLNVAIRCYGYRSSDRVYQALTLAFDYSIEEIWVPLLTGATLVPAPTDGNLAGEDLTEYLQSNRITAMCCVPTLLATIDDALPSLRFLMVSGEACSQALADKWTAPGRRVLNTYGPTETTVSATWQVLNPGTQVTIGGPLAGYSIVLLDPQSTAATANGECGEICIAGAGLSSGYLNLPQRNEIAFIDDFIGIDENLSGKIYRTGDLGRIGVSNEIHYLGRIDSQIKIRGYRIEVSEIESVLASIDDLFEVAVCSYEPATNQKELVAYYTEKKDQCSVPPSDIQQALGERLPAYMVPAYYEKLQSMPKLPSGKIDRHNLPVPNARRLLSSGKPYCEAESELEKQLADILAAILQVDRVSVQDDFFDDLSANSLLMAKFVTRIRKAISRKGISLKKIYQNPTISALANALLQMQPRTTSANTASAMELMVNPVGDKLVDVEESSDSKRIDSSIVEIHPTPAPAISSQATTAYSYTSPDSESGVKGSAANEKLENSARCGLMQCLVYCVYIFVFAVANLTIYSWISSADSIVDIYMRAVVGGSSLFFGTAALLIAVKWLSIGRFKIEVFPVWSSRYLRFWIARTAVLANPLNLFRGTPVYNVFLRALGVQVGRQSNIFARPPVCCDLVSIGHNTVIRDDVFITGYTAESGTIRTGRVSIGSHSYVGEAAVLDINCSIGDYAQLGHASALLEKQQIPDSGRFHGSPAEPTETDYIRLPTLPVSKVRRIVFTLFQCAAHTFLSLPLLVTLVVLLASQFHFAGEGLDTSPGTAVAALLAVSAMTYLVAIVSAIASVLIIPRLLNSLMRPETVHPVYGWQFCLGQAMNRFSNSRLLNWLFGDSSMILHYLRLIGYDMSQATQTGSNFGVDQRQHSPFLCRFGHNTLVSDRLRLMNLQVSNSAWKISDITVPADTYLGNSLHYPVGAKLSSNCLIGTKTMIPIDGPLHSNTGILGSPAFAIPRSVASDHHFDHYQEPALLKQRLRLKLKSNLVTLSMYMTKSCLQIFIILVIAWQGTSVYQSAGYSSVIAQATVATIVVVGQLLVVVLFSIFCERLSQSFRPLKPQHCSIYDRRFWQHERFWKMNSNLALELFNATPIKPFFNRFRGVKIGSNMFDDGVAIVEHDLVKIGDNCTFNVHSVVQCHSLEDGTFKSDHIVVGDDCSFGVGAFVHYGAVTKNNCKVLADSFVMKGTVISENAIWGGNPACEYFTDEGRSENSSGTFDPANHIAVESISHIPADHHNEREPVKKEPLVV